jgi:hypothetical protein
MGLANFIFSQRIRARLYATRYGATGAHIPKGMANEKEKRTRPQPNNSHAYTAQKAA